MTRSPRRARQSRGGEGPVLGPSKVPRLKRVSVAIPEDVLAGMDVLMLETNRRRSDLIREACSLYIEERRRANLREKMKVGYQEMAEINRLLAGELAADFDCVPSKAFSGDDESWRKP